ncbi:hypothetical protein [Streptomyces sp. NPDC020983]|uniref:hypothetical protein n=1 Tax=Streptomyces sp. NPDC020983 TaxID=3365106 RepID=UPI0037A3C8EF
MTPPPPPPPPHAAPTATFPGAGGPPPGAPGVPVPPSPAALFVRRVFSGGWNGAVTAAVVPAVVLLVLAGVLATWSQHAMKNDDVSWQTRGRIALALSVQGLGGHASVPSPYGSRFGDACSSGSDDSGFSDGGDDGDDYSSGGSDFGDSSGDGGDDYYGDSSGDSGDDYFGDSSGDSSGDSGDDYFGDSSGSDFGDSSGDSSGSDFGDSYFGDGSNVSTYSGYRTDGSFRYSDHLQADDCATMTRGVHASVVPLGFTLVWLLALILTLRSVRARTAGPEAAVRVALLTGVLSTALAFYAQPSLNGVELHSGPWRVLLWSFLLSLVTSLVVLNGPALRTRFGAVYRVLSTALLALVVTVLFAGVVVYAIGVGYHDELETPGLIAAAILLPNLGLSGLGLGWGAPFKITQSYSGRSHSVSLGLSKLNDFWDGSATPLAVLGGVLCALAIGLIAASRVRDRAQQFAVAGAFTLMFWLMTVIGGAGVSGLYTFTLSEGTNGHEHVGTDAGQALLFALLWSFGGVLVAPFLRRVFGRGDGPGTPAYAGPSPYAPQPPAGSAFGAPQGYGQPQGGAYVPAQPSSGAAAQPAPAPQPPAQEVHDLGVVQPDRLTKREAAGRDEPEDAPPQP